MGRSLDRLVSSFARRCMRLRGFTPSVSACLPYSMPCQTLHVYTAHFIWENTLSPKAQPTAYGRGKGSISL